ncbi:Uncharacterized protein TCM_028011 [Theobroma cacao]|uniref:Uncharacterized protein n=1 Tax=Theobroma cacao TaxID=3641 RepID=A0A061GA00_THECC|nr:Uncharacterized protein TCM_028011 [Theobroma cacao]
MKSIDFHYLRTLEFPYEYNLKDQGKNKRLAPRMVISRLIEALETNTIVDFPIRYQDQKNIDEAIKEVQYYLIDGKWYLKNVTLAQLFEQRDIEIGDNTKHDGSGDPPSSTRMNSLIVEMENYFKDCLNKQPRE